MLDIDNIITRIELFCQGKPIPFEAFNTLQWQQEPIIVLGYLCEVHPESRNYLDRLDIIQQDLSFLQYGHCYDLSAGHRCRVQYGKCSKQERTDLIKALEDEEARLTDALGTDHDTLTFIKAVNDRQDITPLEVAWECAQWERKGHLLEKCYGLNGQTIRAPFIEDATQYPPRIIADYRAPGQDTAIGVVTFEHMLLTLIHAPYAFHAMGPDIIDSALRYADDTSLNTPTVFKRLNLCMNQCLDTPRFVNF